MTCTGISLSQRMGKVEKLKVHLTYDGASSWLKYYTYCNYRIDFSRTKSFYNIYFLYKRGKRAEGKYLLRKYNTLTGSVKMYVVQELLHPSFLVAVV